MNYAKINTVDVANGPGVRVSLFVSGCKHHCKGCFNEVAWDFNYGEPFTDEVFEILEKHLSKPYISGLTILGGEPLDPKNIHQVANIVTKMKTTYPHLNIWVYTGYTFEYLRTSSSYNMAALYNILDNIDVLVDGPFIESQKDLTLKFRGSSNQRLIDIKMSKKHNKIITIE